MFRLITSIITRRRTFFTLIKLICHHNSILHLLLHYLIIIIIIITTMIITDWSGLSPSAPPASRVISTRIKTTMLSSEIMHQNTIIMASLMVIIMIIIMIIINTLISTNHLQELMCKIYYLFHNLVLAVKLFEMVYEDLGNKNIQEHC